MIVVSYMTDEPDYDKIKDLVYGSENNYSDSSSLKLDKILTVILILCVLIIWWIFS